MLAAIPGLTLLPLYFELDGSFPNHEANPLEPANLVDLQRYVLASRADIGLAFDGDADRCFVVDERGDAVSPSAVTALIADRELTREPGATVMVNRERRRIEVRRERLVDERRRKERAQPGELQGVVSPQSD